MGENRPKAFPTGNSGLPSCGPDESSHDADLSAWKEAVYSNNKAAAHEMAVRFLSTEGERWLALAGHVAYFYLQTGEFNQAAEVYDEILRRDPSNTEARYLAFRARLREGQMDTARDHLQVVLCRIGNLPDDLRKPARGFAFLLLDFDPAKGRGRLSRYSGSILGEIASWILPPPRWGLGQLSLALWRWNAVLAPRQFRAPRDWVRLHDDAPATVRRVRSVLARMGDRRSCTPAELWVGSVKTHESLRLYSVARWMKPNVIVQSGVFAGYSACLLAEACRQNGQGIVHCVDPNIPHWGVLDPLAWAHELAADLGLLPYLRFYKGTFATPVWPQDKTVRAEPAPVVGPEVFAETGQADLVFVDGDHSASAVLADVTLAACNLAEGGAILLHDTVSWRQVRVAVCALLEENRVGLRCPDAPMSPWIQRAVGFSELCPGGFDGLGLFTLAPPVVSPKQD